MKKRKPSVKNVTSLPPSFCIDNIELQPLVIIAKTLAKNRTATSISRLSATVYLLGFNLAKQGAVVIFSSIAGGMYASPGFQSTYTFLAISVLLITVISVFTLKNDKAIKEKLVAAVEK
ncbi:MFS transporter [Selenomonas ruminantium]|uniref:MFS transporter n=1 Tax=Selenomonas ruminantium TaxID=971 RepID=UPI00094D2C1D|nr:MFS transporter [Selenomonas ruminantium]